MSPLPPEPPPHPPHHHPHSQRMDLTNLSLGVIFTYLSLLHVVKTSDVVRYSLYWVYLALMVLLLSDSWTIG